MAFKPVGVDENGDFPQRVQDRLKTIFAAIKPSVSTITVPTGTKICLTFDFTNPAVARPSVTSNCYVRWRGPSRPTNMAVGDEFVAVEAVA